MNTEEQKLAEVKLKKEASEVAKALAWEAEAKAAELAGIAMEASEVAEAAVKEEYRAMDKVTAARKAKAAPEVYNALVVLLKAAKDRTKAAKEAEKAAWVPANEASWDKQIAHNLANAAILESVDAEIACGLRESYFFKRQGRAW